MCANETELFKQKAFTPNGNLTRRIVGHDAVKIAEYIGIERDYLIRLIVVPSEDVRSNNPSAVIHTRDRNLAKQFANTIKASRILVNSPGLQGIAGGCTGLTPSFTLGCGRYGGTSTTDNVSFRHLVYTKLECPEVNYLDRLK